MPHVILNGPISLEAFQRQFTPLEIRWERAVLKLNDCYLNTRGTSLLLDCVVIDNGPPKVFLLQAVAEAQSSRASVRLYGRADFERTPAVKRLICEIAARIKAANAAIVYGNTNIPEFLVH
jgi:hypothetical protein